MTVRKSIEAQLKADWASIPTLAGVRVVATEKPLDEITRLTALIRQKGVGRCPEAPKSHRNVSLLLTLISPHTNTDAAQDQLDATLPAVLDYLDPKYAHGDAEAVGWTGKRLAYDIPFTVRAKKTDMHPEPEEAP